MAVSNDSIQANVDAGFERDIPQLPPMLRQVFDSIECLVGRVNHLQTTVDQLNMAMTNLERIILERGIPPPSPRPLPAPLYSSSKAASPSSILAAPGAARPRAGEH